MRTLNRLLVVGALAVSTLAAPNLGAPALAATGTAVPALTGTGHCPVRTLSTLEGTTVAGGGVATIVAGGLQLQTPQRPAKATFTVPLAVAVPMAAVSALSYTAVRTSAGTDYAETVAAYKLGIDANSDGTVDGVLVYEPYQNGLVAALGVKQTHDALNGAVPASRGGKWWYSAEPGNAQTTATWAAWAAGKGAVAFPAPKIRWVALGQGTWNAGATSVVNNLRFKARGVCKKVDWTAPKPAAKPGVRFADTCKGTVITLTNEGGTAPAQFTLTVSATPNFAEDSAPLAPDTTADVGPYQPSVGTITVRSGGKVIGVHTWKPPTVGCTPSEEPSAPAEPGDEPSGPAAPPAPGTGGGGTLPVTGPQAVLAGLTGLALLVIGAAAVIVARRRRTTFAAE